MPKVMYLCDGKVSDCKKKTCYINGGGCRRTSKVEHAINFENIEDRYYREKENGKTFQEECSAREKTYCMTEQETTELP